MTLPPDRRLSISWQEAAARVDAAPPGEWVLVAEDTSANIGHRIRSGALAAFRPAGAYEARTRSTGVRGRVSCYARRKQ